MKCVGIFLLFVLLSAFFLSAFWGLPPNTPHVRPWFFPLELSFLFVFDFLLIWIGTAFWKHPEDAFLFYAFSLPVRLLTAVLSLTPYPLLLQGEVLLLVSASLPKGIKRFKGDYSAFGFTFFWVFLLGPIVASFVWSEAFDYQNRWHLYSPLFWLVSNP